MRQQHDVYNHGDTGQGLNAPIKYPNRGNTWLLVVPDWLVCISETAGIFTQNCLQRFKKNIKERNKSSEQAALQVEMPCEWQREMAWLVYTNTKSNNHSLHTRWAEKHRSIPLNAQPWCGFAPADGFIVSECYSVALHTWRSPTPQAWALV